MVLASLIVILATILIHTKSVFFATLHVPLVPLKGLKIVKVVILVGFWSTNPLNVSHRASKVLILIQLSTNAYCVIIPAKTALLALQTLVLNVSLGIYEEDLFV